MSQIQKLKEARAKLVADTRAKFDAAPDGVLDGDGLVAVRAMNADIDRLGEQIEIAERAFALDNERRSIAPETQGAPRQVSSESRDAALTAYFRGGMGSLSPEFRAQLKSNTELGGVTVPVDSSFMAQVVASMSAASPVLRLARQIVTDNGQDILFVTSNHSVNATIVADGTQHSQGANVSFGSVTLKAHVFTTGPRVVSNSLLRDSAVNLASFLGEEHGRIIARGIASFVYTGTGTAQPKGLFTAATLSQNTASNTAITIDDLIAAQAKLDPSYDGVWLMSPGVAASLRTLKANTTSGMYVWQPSVIAGQPDLLLGKPVYVDAALPATVTANTDTIVYGDPSKWAFRRVAGVNTKVLNEVYADYNAIGLLTIAEADFNVLDVASLVKVKVKA